MHPVLRKAPLFYKTPFIFHFFYKIPLIFYFFTTSPPLSNFLQNTPISFPAYGPADVLVLAITHVYTHFLYNMGGSVAEWLACCAGLRRRRARVQIAAATLSDKSLRQTVHTHRASVHQAAKLVAALLRVARVSAGLAESTGGLPPGL